MTMRRYAWMATATVMVVGAATAFAVVPTGRSELQAPIGAADVADLTWDDLVPEPTRTASLGSGVVTHENLTEDTSPWQAMTDVSEVRSDLNGTRVRIPGYMTPLSFEDAEVGEFLLVPYVGACVHVPPPPANQIVYVEVKGTVPVFEMWEPFAAVGTLYTEPQSTELAEVGYTLQLEHLEVYEEDPIEVVDDEGNASAY